MKAVIFDMDGVIFDSERCTLLSWQVIADRYGLLNLEENYNKCIGVTREVTEQIMKDAYGESFPYERFAKEASAWYHERYDGGRLPMKPGVRELLSYLKEQGVPTALASSTREERVRQYLRDAGLLPYFQAIIGGESAKRSKPAPDIFLIAAEALGAEPAGCVVIEDSYNGIRAAHAAGMRPIMVPDMLDPDETIKAMCETVKPTLLDVLSYLKENG